jgi:hypothetical protein
MVPTLKGIEPMRPDTGARISVYTQISYTGARISV